VCSSDLYDDTHNRDVLSDFFNSASQQHTTSLTSEIIVISGSTSVTLIGNVSASIISASTINGLGNPLTFSTSVDSRLDAFEAVSSSYARTNVNNSFDGTQTFNNITVNGTASINYLQTVTGSAKVIGDAFIILNNDTPVERYAGIIVLDSGSAGTSASFQFDGQTNDWFYEYTSALDSLNFGVTLFGPEYGTKGSPIYNTNNRIVKGNGGHHINDSNITDDGTTVSINSNTQITGSLLVNGNSVLVGSNLTSLNNFTQSQQLLNTTFATTGSNTFVGTQNFTQPITASVITFPTGSLGNGINLFQDGLSQIRFYSGSTTTQVGTWVNMQVNPSNGALAISSFPANNHFVDFDVEQTASIFDAPIKGFGGTLKIGSNTTITGSVIISGSAAIDLEVIGNIRATGSIAGQRTAMAPDGLFAFNGVTQSSVVAGTITNTNGVNAQYITNGFGGVIGNYDESDFSEIGLALDGNEFTTNWANGPILYVNNTPGDTYEGVFGFQNKTNYTDGRITALKRLDVSGSVNIQNTLTASLQQGYVWVGNSSGRTTTVATSSFGGAVFPFAGNAQITGSLGVTGSVSGFVNTLAISSNTASLDFNNGNFFTLQLVSGSITHLTATNIKPGQTINLLVRTDSGSAAATGSLTFSPTFKFAGGFDYTPTAITASQDLVSFVTFDTTQILASQVKNLS
jgi:hypothetical protein